MVSLQSQVSPPTSFPFSSSCFLRGFSSSSFAPKPRNNLKIKQNQHSVIKASWQELAGVLLFSAIPFTTVKAIANSPLGQSLQRRLEERKKFALANSSKFKALAEKARKESFWYGEDRPQWLGPIPYDYPAYLTGELPGDYGFDIAGLAKDPVALQKYFNSPIQQPYAANRRQLILHSALAAFTFPLIVPNGLAASDLDVRVYTDDENKFKIAIPQEWQVGKGELNGFKSVTAFYPEENPSSNVSIVITGLGPDFTKMESFGKVEEFAETLVSGLDRSWQRPPGVAAKLIDCKAANGFYYIDYSLQNPGETRKYLYSAIGMASNGWYNRLYTVTGQFVEEDFSKYSSQIHQTVASFGFT